MFGWLSQRMRAWVASSEERDRRRVQELVGGQEPRLFATATSLGDVAAGLRGTLILTANHLHFVAPNPGRQPRRIDLLLTEIREVTTEGAGLATRVAVGSPALTALAIRAADGQTFRFRVYRDDEWASAIAGVRAEALHHRLD